MTRVGSTAESIAGLPAEGGEPSLADAPIFRDRQEAGRLLSDALAHRGLAGAICVGLARGGLVPAVEVAARLALPLDVLAVRKVGYPGHPDYAIGAVTPGGGLVLRDTEGIPWPLVEAAVAAARESAEALDRRLHGDEPALTPAGKIVVLVDDGLATGATMLAAVRWARVARAPRVVVAAPVGPPEAVAALEAEADEVVCPRQPPAFLAVGVWYEDFAQVTDEDVSALLAAYRGHDGR